MTCPKCTRETNRGYFHTLACPGAAWPAHSKCVECNGTVNFDPQSMRLWCSASIDRRHLDITEETVRDGYVPAAWWPWSSDWFNLPRPAAPQPAGDPDNCPKCGKAMTVLGLNRTYPPKRDDMGRPICPHCPATAPPSGPPSVMRTAFCVDGGYTALMSIHDHWIVKRRSDYGDYDEHDHEYEDDKEMDDDA